MVLPRRTASDRPWPVVPLFPLPNVFLFPGCVMPLHIFEPRYRSMIEDLLDRPGRLVMATLLEGDCADDESSKVTTETTADDPAALKCPPVSEIAGLGEIGRHERLPDGRFLLWLFGVGRVRLREIESDRAYRLVEIEPFQEFGGARKEAAECRERVLQALFERSSEFLELPEGIPLSHIVDLLLQRLGLPSSVMLALFCEPNVTRRAELALLEHVRRPMPST